MRLHSEMFKNTSYVHRGVNKTLPETQIFMQKNIQKTWDLLSAM
jgi:hypothetical protein